MPGTDIVLWLALVGLLGLYAYIKHRQALRWQGDSDEPANWIGKAIDVTDLKPKLETVRRNYLAARQLAPGLCFHRALVELARHAVAGLAYFRDREPEERGQ
jgi:hypothetical protein